MRKRRYDDLFRDEDEVDPRSSLMNLFDVAMVFAVALMVAFVLRTRMTEFLTSENATYVKNAGSENMEIIVKKDNKVTRYRAGDPQAGGKGRKVGIAYQLENGEVIYVPEGEVK